MTDEERTAQIAMLEIRAAKLGAILRKANIDPNSECPEEIQMRYYSDDNEEVNCSNCPYSDYCDTLQGYAQLRSQIFELENPPNVPLIF